MLLGAATFANYLAAFVACAAMLHTVFGTLPPASCRGLAPASTSFGVTPSNDADGRANHWVKPGGDGPPGHDDKRRFHPGRVRRTAGRELAMTMGPIFIGFVIWLPADLWFFLAQRQTRMGQFVPFEPISATARLAQYSGAALFGGLPLYVDGVARTGVT